MSAVAQKLENPVQGPARKPEWAQMIRRGGDHVAVLFEHLRREISRIEGLTEELADDEEVGAWNPRYRQGGNVLFAARIAPGVLEVFMPFDADERERLLVSPRLGAPMKQALREASARGESFLLRIRLMNRTKVSSFARLAILKNALQRRPLSR